MNRTVLIIDDDVNLQIIAETLLRLRDLDVRVARGAVEASEILAKYDVGVAVVDLNRDGMDVTPSGNASSERAKGVRPVGWARSRNVMWNRLCMVLSITALSALVALIGFGCGGDDLFIAGQPPPSPSPVPTGTCLQAGAVCSVSTDCCSGVCIPADGVTTFQNQCQ